MEKNMGNAAAADEQLEVVTDNSEEVGGGSTTTAGSSSTAELIDLQDAGSLRREFAGLFRCSKRMRLAADDNEIDIYSIPQVSDQSATGNSARDIESNNETSDPNLIDQTHSIGQSSFRWMNGVVTSNFDVNCSSGTSNSVISGSHNVILHDGSEVDSGSMVDQDSYVQETNLGNCKNGCHSLELQKSVEGSDYQRRGNRDSATSSQYTADESFRTSYILPAQPFSCSPMERWKGLEREVQKEKAALSEETIMKRLVTRDYVPSTATNDLEASSALDYSEQVCSICLVGYENHDKVGVLYYCEHEFHADCLKTWLLKQNTCPICRVPALIPTHLPDYDDDVDVHRAFFLPVCKAKKFLPGLLS